MQTESQDPVPTSSEQDIFLRWVSRARASDKYYLLDHNAGYSSVGTVFGKEATARAVHCMGNSFIDMTVVIDDQPDNQLRVIIYYNSLQGIQLHHSYGLVSDPTTGRCTGFQPYALERLINFVQDLVA